MSDHDGHTIDAGPVTAGTCGCSNNFGHTCEEVARLRAENAQAWAINRVVKGTNERLADEVDRLRADAMAKAHRVGELGREVDRLRTIRDLAAEALAELDAQPDLAHPDAVWYTGAALRDALEADRG